MCSSNLTLTCCARLFQSILAWARRVWLRRADTEDQRTLNPSPGAPLGCVNPTSPQDPTVEREPDSTDVHETNIPSPVPGGPAQPSPQQVVPPSFANTGEAESEGRDHEAASDSCSSADRQGALPEKPAAQPMPNHDEPDEAADTTDLESDHRNVEAPGNMPPERSGDGSHLLDKAPTKSPRNIGSRRNRQTPTPRPRSPQPPCSWPELICRQNPGSLQWEVVLSADDECDIAEVRHDGGEPLSMLNSECCLSSFTGRLSIALKDGEHRKFTLFDDTPMVFKSRNNWDGDGRKVGGITSGYFIVIVPTEWKRTGHAPVERERCADPDFTAHFFFRDKGAAAEDVGGFEECEVALTQFGLELTGERVFDDSEDGELFVGAVPKLNPLSGVVWARIGEESKGGWPGENFKPSERSLADVLHRRQGRFFVRVFDDDTKLLDSGEFRYLRDLREIRVNGEPYSTNTLLVPPSKGHSPTELQFVGADGATIHPTLATGGTHTTLQPRGVLIVEPHPEREDIRCALKSGACRVDTVIRLPRIWWRMERDDGEPDEWRDTPLAMTRQEYREYANTGAVVRLRLPPRITSVNVGFHEELDRVNRPKRGETELRLADFVDYSHIDQRLNEDASLNIQCGEAVLTLIRVSADPVPTIISFTSEPTVVAAGERAILHWVTRDVEADGVSIDPGIGLVESSGSIPVAPTETMTYTLRLAASSMDDVTKDLTLTVLSRPQPREKLFARVKRADGGWRRGKGFSRGEIHAAGLTSSAVPNQSIPIDKRRRSIHSANIDTIGRFDDVRCARRTTMA